MEIVEVEAAPNSFLSHDFEIIGIANGVTTHEPEAGSLIVANDGVLVEFIDEEDVIGKSQAAQEWNERDFHPPVPIGVAQGECFDSAVFTIYPRVCDVYISIGAYFVFSENLLEVVLERGVESRLFVPASQITIEVYSLSRADICFLRVRMVKNEVEQSFEDHDGIETQMGSPAFDNNYCITESVAYMTAK